MLPTFTFILITTLGMSQVPGVREAECVWMRDNAAAMAERFEVRLVEARCEREKA